MGLVDQHILIGIDGGGSGCRIAATDSAGMSLGDALSGPANVTSDRFRALSNVQAAVDKLQSQHGISDEQLEGGVAHVGLAGVITQADKDAVKDALPFAYVTVTDDCATSLIGALGDRFGVLAAIGTGTIIAAKSPSGIRRFGGWGLQISDQASGAWLGRKALERCVMAHDGLVAPSDLTSTLMSQHDNALTTMVAFAKDATPADYAKLARFVVDGARAGDKNAVHLMQDGATYLNQCVQAADPQDGDIVCLSAGIGPHYAAYLEPEFQSRVKEPLGTPLDGALALAKQAYQSIRAAS